MQKIDLIPRELPYEVNEELKYLRTNIQFCGTDKKVIVFTSTVAGEGKSTLVLALARSLCELGKSVLLVDADLRRSILKYETANPKLIQQGMSHYLTGMSVLNDVLAETDVPGFYILFAGHVPPNPAELLANKRVDALLKWGREQFDYVLIDSAPLGTVIDAAVIAPKCDGAVVVIEAARMPYRMVQSVVQQLGDANCPVLGVVLNKVNRRGNRKSYNQRYNYEYRRDSKS